MSSPWRDLSTQLTPSPHQRRPRSARPVPTSQGDSTDNDSTIENAVNRFVDILSSSGVRPGDAMARIETAMASVRSNAVPSSNALQPPADLEVNKAIWGFEDNTAPRNAAVARDTHSRVFVPMAAVQQRANGRQRREPPPLQSALAPAASFTATEAGDFSSHPNYLQTPGFERPIQSQHPAARHQSSESANQSTSFFPVVPNNQQLLNGLDHQTKAMETSLIASSRPQTWGGAPSNVDINQIYWPNERPRSFTDAAAPSREHRPSFSGNQNNLNGATASFRPMRSVMDQAGRQVVAQQPNPSPTRQMLASPLNPRFSERYQGRHVEDNASAEYLPDELNCALWVRNLPADVTYHQLLSSIRVGRIWATYINYPDHFRHQTAAAKIVFFSSVAANLYLQQMRANPPMNGRLPVLVERNRIKSPETEVTNGISRVLIVTGHVAFVNYHSLRDWFESKFTFETDIVRELARAGSRAVVEWRFGSYRSQGQIGRLALKRERPVGLEKVEFGEDPCERGEAEASRASREIAFQRLHGIGLWDRD